MAPSGTQSSPYKVPTSSCRTGQMVNMLTAQGLALPVRIKVTQVEEADGTSNSVVVVSSQPWQQAVRTRLPAPHAKQGPACRCDWF